jgi:hypothetical protein
MTSGVWTPYAELNQVPAALVSGVEKVLVDNLVGLYLQGSFAVGDFDEHSDVDFIVVIDRDLSNDQVADLRDLHFRIYHLDSEWAKHLEGSYFPRASLAALDPGKPLWYLDHGASDLVLSGHCNTIVVRSVMRDYGLALVGPRPSTLVAPIPVALLRREILSEIQQWGYDILQRPEAVNNRFYQGFIVLNYCRMLHDLWRGAVGSKRAGAAWASQELNPSWRGLVDRAWHCRPDPATSVRQPPDADDFRRTLDFVRYCMEYSSRWGGHHNASP